MKGKEQVKGIAVATADLLGRHDLGGHFEGVQQDFIDLGGEGETDGKANGQGPDTDDQARSQLDQMFQQGRAGGFDFGLVVIETHAASPLVAVLRLRAGLAGAGTSTATTALGLRGLRGAFGSGGAIASTVTGGVSD